MGAPMLVTDGSEHIAKAHLSMMTDTLIANLPPSILRSTIRHLLCFSSVPKEALAAFNVHVQSALGQDPPPFMAPAQLFPPSTFAGAPSDALQTYRVNTKLLFTAGLSIPSLDYFTNLLQAVVIQKATWTEGSSLESFLASVSHDIVQCLQAVKESDPERKSSLSASLLELKTALEGCRDHCAEAGISFPFKRCLRQVIDATNLLFPYFLTPSPPLTPEAKIKITYKRNTLTVPTTTVTTSSTPIKIPKLFTGLWQMSSPSWGTASEEKIDSALVDLIQNGFFGADMADHYGDAEILFGNFRNRVDPVEAEKIFLATKWCVFAPITEEINLEYVLARVQERADRCGGTVQLLQFHWQDYSNKAYLPIIEHLVSVTRSHPHLVTSIGLCNFSSAVTDEVCAYMFQKTGEVGIVSNQIQFSLIDARPVWEMSKVCEKYGLKLLTYGTFCGGFLADKFLGAPAPVAYGGDLTPSQRKYYDMILSWSTSWDTFQNLLQTLRKVGDKHGGVSIGSVAAKWVLSKDYVSTVIIGSRLGVSSHADENLKIFSFELTQEDLEEIEASLEKGKVKGVFETVGDCGQEYR